MSDISTLSTEQLLALVKEREAEVQAALDATKAERKTEEEQRKAELALLGADYIEHIISTVPLVTTESTGRVGRSVNSMPYTGADGVERTVSIHITDVKASEVGRAQVKLKKAAEEQGVKDKAAAAALGIAA